MQVDEFGQSIEPLSSVVATLLRRTEESLSPQALLKIAFAELFMAKQET